MPRKSIAPAKQKGHVRRRIEAKEPLVLENTKRSLCVRGLKCSATIRDVLSDIHRLKAPHSIKLARPNDISPFEDETGLDFLTVKNDCSLFAFGSHNKKRPDNLVLGRTFDGHVLDMVEFGVRNFRPVESFKDAVAKRMGSKPAMVFTGDAWDNIEILGRLRNLLIDFFRGDVVDDICLAGLDHVMVVTAPDVPAGDVPGQAAVGSSILLHLRHYHIAFTKSAGGGAPSVELHPIGPAMDLAVRRSKLASPDLWKAALKKAKQNVTKKVKNISSSEMGDKLGRIHLGRQDLSSMQVRRVKALREPRGKRKAEDEAGADSGSDDED